MLLGGVRTCRNYAVTCSTRVKLAAKKGMCYIACKHVGKPCCSCYRCRRCMRVHLCQVRGSRECVAIHQLRPWFPLRTG